MTVAQQPAQPPSSPTTGADNRRGALRWLAVAGIVVGGFVVLAVLLWPATAWLVEHIDGVDLHEKDPRTGREVLAGKDRQEILDKARGRITGVATGVLAAVAIYYTASNARSARQAAHAAQENVQAALRASQVSEESQRRTFELTQQGLRQSEHAQRQTEEAQRRTHELTERGQLTDRFTAAVAQLGDSNPAVQLGGVHALAGIAGDGDPTMRQTCIDVLCAYLRLPYTAAPTPVSDYEDWLDGSAFDDSVAALDAYDALIADYQKAAAAYRALREVRHTIIRLIGNHLRLEGDHARSWHGHDFDFTGVVFDGGDLHGACFSGGTATFVGATFTHDFDFTETVFSGGKVSFRGATFSNCYVDFRRATFSGGRVSFGGATFSDRSKVDFRGATFSGGLVHFWQATFADRSLVRLDRSTFSGGRVGFVSARFSGGKVGFTNATISAGQLDFRRATFSDGQVNFENAQFLGGRVYFRRVTFSGKGQVDFRKATFSGSKVNFVSATLSGGMVRFTDATFSGGMVDFRVARFSGGKVGFEYATFSGGKLNFRGATFAGGEVNFSSPRVWDSPPTAVELSGHIPEGVIWPNPT